MGKKNIVWNDYISKKERFADFFNGVVFHGKQMVHPEDLTELNTKLWRRQQGKNSYHEYIRDVVQMWNYQGKKYILGLEPEESPHSALPVKYMNYESLEYDRQYKEILQNHRRKKDLSSGQYLSGFSKTDRLIPVVTFGVYLGEKLWVGFESLSEMTGAGEESGEIREYLAPLWNDFHVNRIDIHALGASDIFQTDLREVFGFLKYQGDKEKLRKYVLKNEHFLHLREDAYDVLSIYGENEKLLLKKEEYRTEEGMNMCTALKEWEEEARAEGRVEGRAEERNAMNNLIFCLVNAGRIDDLKRASRDMQYQEKLMREFGIQVNF